MSDRQIRVGDLVRVYRGKQCCGLTGHLGRIFAVIAVKRVVGHCFFCKKQFVGFHAYGVGHEYGYQTYSLKRIDRPQQSDSESTERR